jgi:hypothetical protein
VKFNHGPVIKFARNKYNASYYTITYLIEDVVNVVKPQYSTPTHTCFTFCNCVCDYILAWWYNLPSIDACSKLNEENSSTNKKEI